MPVILQVPPVFRRFVYPWITPAHAGKTSTPALTGFPLRDHPRACGENTSMAMTQASTTGSPPRMRGKRAQPSPAPFWSRITPPRMRGKHTTPAAQSPGPGITPAHAGKTPACQSSQAPPWDHPRACGENHGRQLDFDGEKGSPPRMRGKQQGGRADRESEGITPAHAGKTAQGGAAV